MTAAPDDLDEPGDAELIKEVRAGTVSAYGMLYERHVDSARTLARQLSRSRADADELVSDAFAKVLDTLRAGRGPDSAFRAYLLTALRHTAYDRTRRDRKVELVDDLGEAGGVVPFDDPAVAGLERALALRAFALLPERWQAVLWHCEVEGQSMAEVAVILGLTPNGVSSLAHRAREGLRQVYLQVHLVGATDSACRAVAERLGAWTRSGLAKGEKAQVEEHLDECARCCALADVNGAVRMFVAPLVLGAGALGYLAAAAAKSSTALAAAGVAGSAGVASAAEAAGAAGSGAMPRQLLGVAASSIALAAAIVVGLVSAGADQGDQDVPTPTTPRTEQHSTAPPSLPPSPPTTR